MTTWSHLQSLCSWQYWVAKLIPPFTSLLLWLPGLSCSAFCAEGERTAAVLSKIDALYPFHSCSLSWSLAALKLLWPCRREQVRAEKASTPHGHLLCYRGLSLYVPRPHSLFLSCLQEEHREQNPPSSVWCFTGIYAKSQAVADVPECFQPSLWDLGRPCRLLLGCNNVPRGPGGSDAVLARPRVPWCSISWLPESHLSLWYTHEGSLIAWVWLGYESRRCWIPLSLVSALMPWVSHLSSLP